LITAKLFLMNYNGKTVTACFIEKLFLQTITLESLLKHFVANNAG